jgi:hypothetical protein
MESPITPSVFAGFSETKVMKFEPVTIYERCPSFKVIRSGSDHE